MREPKAPIKMQAWLDDNKEIIDEYWFEDDGYSENERSPYSIWCCLKPEYICAESETTCIHAATVDEFLWLAKSARKRLPEEYAS